MVFSAERIHNGYDVVADIYAYQTKTCEKIPGNRKNHKRLLGGFYGWIKGIELVQEIEVRGKVDNA